MMMMMIMIMSIRSDYVSELPPPTGILFTPYVIHEYGAPWWNDDVDRGKLLTRPPEVSGNPISRDIW
jgi:hypothetical protein